MTVPKNRPWIRMKAEYVEGINDGGRVRWPTLDEVALRGNTNAANVRKRAARDGWGVEKAAFQRRIDQQRAEQRSTEIATLAADLDVHALRLARSGISVTAARLAELGAQVQQRAEILRQQREGLSNASPPPAPDSDEVRILARAATDWYDLGLKALGQEAPQRLVIEGDEAHPLRLDVHQRDERTVRIMNILSDAGVLPDVNGNGGGGLVLEAVGGPTQGAGGGADAPEQPVHPADADDRGQPEPEATGVPAAG